MLYFTIFKTNYLIDNFFNVLIYQLITFGSHLFIFSIFAFNTESQMSISHEVEAVAVGKIIMNTIICVASCAITGLLFERFIIERSANGWNYSTKPQAANWNI